MSERANNHEAFLEDLGPVVDGDPEALERHADHLAEDDEARDLRHEAAEVADQLRYAGGDFVPDPELEAKVLARLDALPPAERRGSDGRDAGRTTLSGFATPEVGTPEGTPSAPPAPRDEIDGSVVPSSSSGQDGASRLSAERAPAASAEKPPRKVGKLLLFPVVGVAALAAAAAAVGFLFWRGDGGDTPPPPTIATTGIGGRLEAVDRAAADGRTGVDMRRPSADAFLAVGPGESLEPGSLVRTDERTRARISLADGSEVVLNHATELELVADTPRGFRLHRGELVADIAHLSGAPHASFMTPTGRVEVLGTKFILSATEDVTSVRVSRGVVAVSGAEGTSAEVRAGEEGLIRQGQQPDVTPIFDLARSLVWSELSGDAEDAASEDADTIAGIGSLRARRPGERGDRERSLTLARHQARVRIVGNVARTEIEEVFRNDSDHTLEGIYRFPLPPDAQIARLALDVDGRLEEGAFVERDRAAQIWRGVIRNATPRHQRDDSEEFIWVPGPWRDPAILEWQRGGQFELRIFPIPAHGERRVVLAYTQTVQPQGERRRYVYPLAHSADDSTRVGQFDLDVRVAGAERVEARGYRLTRANDEDAARLSLAQEDFRPKGDLIIDYELSGGERDLRWWTYRGEAPVAPPETSRQRDHEVLDLQRALARDRRPYVAFALRPRLPRASERQNRDYVLVVDASQSMVGERYHRASRLAAHLVSELDRRDRFTILVCDYECRAMPGGLQPSSAQAARQAQQWLGGIEPAGASDVMAVLREAVATVSAERRDDRELSVLYVGDGISTAGYRRASLLAAETEQLARDERVVVSTVGIGSDADTMALRAMARAGRGHYVPYVPGQRVSVAAVGVLESTYGASLESPRLELPAGLSDVAPADLPTIRAGQEVIVVARMDRDRVQGDVVLRGTVAGRSFEQRYEVDLVPTESAGNRFVPRLWAAQRIEQLQLSGRGEERAPIIAHSKAFGVLSPHTSLLVLESEAMFRAFHVDRREATPDWTGEEDVVAGEAEAQDLRQSGVFDFTGGGAVSTRGLATQPRRSEPVAGPGARRPSSAIGAQADRPAPGASGASAGAPALFRRRLEERSVPAPEAERSLRGNDMPEPDTTMPQVGPVPPRTPPPRRSGRWMRREYYRAARILAAGQVSPGALRAAEEAETALEANPDSRDRHREAVRRLSLAGRLERALEVTEAWIERDRLDPEALTAKADLLGRLGRRDEALRLLTGTVDLAPNQAALHDRLASAFERAGRPERACAHRIALAEIDQNDPTALARAIRCERQLSRDSAAGRLLSAVRDASVRTRAERGAREEVRERPFRGDFTIEAEWSGGGDLDLSLVTIQGTRLSWMGGRTTVTGEHAREANRESLGLRWTAPGTYLVEVSRTDPTSRGGEVSGRLSIRVLGETRTVPFTLRGAREVVAKVRVTRESRLVPVTGTVVR